VNGVLCVFLTGGFSKPMKFSYKFSNLCGSVYKQGNLVFTADGNCVLSPVGNRISVFDLVNHKCITLNIENRKNISRLALSPDGHSLLSVDEDGHAIFINFLKRVVVGEFHFKKAVQDIKFSPDSQFFAITSGRHVQVWHTPPLITQFRPFVLHRTYTGHYDDVIFIQWSPDSQFFVTGSKDMTARLYSRDPVPGFKPLVMSGHRNHVVGCFFGSGSDFDKTKPGYATQRLYTVAKDGAMFVWRFDPRTSEEAVAIRAAKSSLKQLKKTSTHQLHTKRQREEGEGGEGEGESSDDEREGEKKRKVSAEEGSVPLPHLATGKYVLEKRHFFDHNHSKIASCSYHTSPQTGLGLLVVGFASGTFSLYETPDIVCVHTLSISQERINTVSVNSSGDWLAFGCEKLGQLLVWEWQSETYVLKQQGHYYDVNSLAYSPDGQYVVTGGDDGKVKLWNTTSGFCFVTFGEHTSPVKSVEFSATGTVVFSCSLDGSVRAYDLVRYRNFRTMATPTPTQLSCVATDNSGEVVVGGGMDPFEVYVWSVQTGRLLDVLSGHTAPVSAVAFSASSSILASASWDKTVKIWDFYNSKNATETLTHSSDVLGLAFRPDGDELVTCALDGQLYFWDFAEAKLKHTIDGKKDILGGRLQSSARASVNNTTSCYFNSLCYSADGTCVLAGGNSKFVCIYECSQRVLLKRFVITENLSLDGTLNYLNSRHMTEAGDLKTIDDHDSEDEAYDRVDSSLPGARTGDFSSVNKLRIARTKCVRFSPTGLQWSAASTEGLLIYSLDETMTFDPSGLDMDITPDNVLKCLASRQFSKALAMSLSLNEEPLIQQVVEQTPFQDISLVVRSMPEHRIRRIIDLLGKALSSSPHLEFYLVWARAILTFHGSFLKISSTKLAPSFRALYKNLNRSYTDLTQLCNENQYLLEYMSSFAGHKQPPQEEAQAVQADGL